jgi:hypothetical protein
MRVLDFSVNCIQILNCSLILQSAFLCDPFIGLILSELETLGKIFWKLNL